MISKEPDRASEREMWNDVLRLKLVHEPPEGTDAAEVLSFVRTRAQGVFDHVDELHSRIARLQADNRRVIEGAAREGHDAEAELAPALGYEHDGYGWVTGEHTSVTLAMEARQRIGELQAANEQMRSALEKVNQHIPDAIGGEPYTISPGACYAVQSALEEGK